MVRAVQGKNAFASPMPSRALRACSECIELEDGMLTLTRSSGFNHHIATFEAVPKGECLQWRVSWKHHGGFGYVGITTNPDGQLNTHPLNRDGEHVFISFDGVCHPPFPRAPLTVHACVLTRSGNVATFPGGLPVQPAEWQ